MSKEEFGGVARAVAASGLGYLAGKGVVDPGLAGQLIPLAGVLGTVLWSVAAKRKPKRTLG